MNTLRNLMLSNALVAAVLFAVLMLLRRWIKNPAVLHLCLLLILVKLITPAYWQPQFTLFTTTSVTPDVAEERISPEDAADVVISNPTLQAAPQSTDQDQEPSESRFPGLNVPAEDNSPSVAKSTANTKSDEAASITGWFSLLTSDTRSGSELFARLCMLVWITGTTGWLLLACWRIIRFQRYLRQALPASEELNHMAKELAQQIGLKSVPRLEIVSGNVSPLLWSCFGRARIILPSRLLEQLNDAEIETLLLHELAHYRRGDYRVRLIELLAMGVYWWYPVLRWVRREIRIAEEACCDAWVVETLPEKRRSYAEVLVKAIGFVSQPPRVLGVTGIGSKAGLEQRLKRIMCDTLNRNIAQWIKLTVAAIALFLLPFAPMLGQSLTPTSGVEDNLPLPTVEEIQSGYRTNIQNLLPLEMTYQFHIKENMNCIHEDRRQLEENRLIATLKHTDIKVDGNVVYDESTFPLVVGEALRQAEELEANLRPERIESRLTGGVSERSYFWSDGKSFQRRCSNANDKLTANLTPGPLSPAALPIDHKDINIISAIADYDPTFLVWFGVNSSYPLGQGWIGNDLNHVTTQKTIAPLGTIELNWAEQPDWYRLDYYLTRPADQYRMIGWREFRGRRTILLDGFSEPRNKDTGRQTRYRLWVDPAHGYLPLRMEWDTVNEQGEVVRGSLHRHLDVFEIKAFANGYYPLRIEFQDYTIDSLGIQKQIEEIGRENLDQQPLPPLPLVPGRKEIWEVTHFTPNKPMKRDDLAFEFPQGAFYRNDVDGRDYLAGKSTAEPKPASHLPHLTLGATAPPLEVTDWLDAKPRQLSDFQGKVVALLFIDGVQHMDYSQIPPEERQQLTFQTQAIKAIHDKYAEKGVIFVEIHPPGTTKEQIQSFHRFREFDALAAIDQSRQEGGVTNVSYHGSTNMDLSLFLIGRDGKIAFNDDFLGHDDRYELYCRYVANKHSIPLDHAENLSEEEAMNFGWKILEFIISEQFDYALSGTQSPILMPEE